MIPQVRVRWLRSAYEALRKNQASSHYMPGALMRSISTREYHKVLPKMAETVGASRSAVSRQAMEASIEQLKQLQEWRWDQVEILVIYIGGQRFVETSHCQEGCTADV